MLFMSLRLLRWRATTSVTKETVPSGFNGSTRGSRCTAGYPAPDCRYNACDRGDQGSTGESGSTGSDSGRDTRFPLQRWPGRRTCGSKCRPRVGQPLDVFSHGYSGTGIGSAAIADGLAERGLLCVSIGLLYTSTQIGRRPVCFRKNK